MTRLWRQRERFTSSKQDTTLWTQQLTLQVKTRFATPRRASTTACSTVHIHFGFRRDGRWSMDAAVRLRAGGMDVCSNAGEQSEQSVTASPQWQQRKRVARSRSRTCYCQGSPQAVVVRLTWNEYPLVLFMPIQPSLLLHTFPPLFSVHLFISASSTSSSSTYLSLPHHHYHHHFQAPC